MNWKQVRASFEYAFKINDQEIISPEESEIFDKIATFVVKRKLSMPAVLFLETVKPLNFVASSVMTFFRPTLGAVLNRFEYEKLEKLLERRSSIKLLINRIEEFENNYKIGKVGKCLK